MALGSNRRVETRGRGCPPAQPRRSPSAEEGRRGGWRLSAPPGVGGGQLIEGGAVAGRVSAGRLVIAKRGRNRRLEPLRTPRVDGRAGGTDHVVVNALVNANDVTAIRALEASVADRLSVALVASHVRDLYPNRGSKIAVGDRCSTGKCRAEGEESAAALPSCSDGSVQMAW